MCIIKSFIKINSGHLKYIKTNKTNTSRAHYSTIHDKTTQPISHPFHADCHKNAAGAETSKPFPNID